MNSKDTVHSLTNKTGDAFDKAFIAEMTAHHNDAITMAEIALKRAKHEEIKKLAENIISAQSNEIKQMSKWQTEWKLDRD